MIEIIAGQPEDIASIMPVMADAFDPEYGEAWTAAQCMAALGLPSSQLLIAKTEQDDVAGFAMSRWVLDEEELLMIGVSSNCRRKNIASLLLAEIKRKAAAANRHKLFLEVREDNSARRFYEKAGFSVIGTRKNYYIGGDGNRRDAVTMQIDIG